jgi:K(+)-stimulated pyrophosphate-energized sodium pump
MTHIYVAGGAAVVALIFAFLKYAAIMRADAGDSKMQEISKQVQDGAAAFLKAEYKWLAVFVVVVAGIIFVSPSAMGLGVETAIAFVSGAFASALAGYFGMHTATRAAVRTTQAARSSLSAGLDVAFSSGVVMGMTVVGLALLGLAIFTYLYAPTFNALGLEHVLGFSFGASSIALFARVGGGIFTKAADVGADLVGKVEAGIPEDDPRNPATIADNVGDNVGDVAGMGADLFESYVGSIVATMTLAASIWLVGQSNAVANGATMVWLPMAISAIGIIAAVIGTYFVKAANEQQIHAALFRGLWVASLVAIAGSAALLFTVPLPADVEAYKLLIAVVSGILIGVLIGKVTEYYTSTETSPVQKIADKSLTGAATNIIAGLAVGMRSVAATVVLISLSIYIANWAGGVYGVALAAVGMLCTLGISLGVDAYGPVADNAGGLAEMAGLPAEVRTRTDALDAVGNTTAAIGKGFAIGSAALTALALFAAFRARADDLLRRVAEEANTTFQALDLSLTNTEVLIGMLLGGILPFLFAALTMEAVGNAAGAMVEEVRRQFREIPGIMDGTGKPDAARCVAISTEGALKQMVLPGMIAVLSPIAVGFWSVAGLAGLLAGALVTGIMMAIFMSNAGGAWDNAKKYIEGGKHGGKKSDAHKAAVVGDTVGDPFKDTSGPSLNILIKLMTVVGLIFLPWFIHS